MPWSQLLLPRRFVSIFITFSCQANGTSLTGSSMKTSFQKTLTPFQTTLLRVFKKRSIYPSSALSLTSTRPSAHRLSPLQYPPVGSSQITPSSLLLSSRRCGHLPFQEFMDDVATTQSGIPSPTLPGDMAEEVIPTLLHCSRFLQVHLSEHKEQENNDNYALVVLNHDLPLLTLFLWHKARCRICADGGANRIYDWIPTLLPHVNPMKVRECYRPDIIKGDLDSIRPEVKEFYLSLGTKVLDDSEDQDTTDLHKCVAYAVESMQDIKKGRVNLLVLGAMGGRLDHEFANLNTLYMFRGVRIILLSNESMAFLLPKGYKHEILIDSSVEGPHCGLVPLGAPSLSTTTMGLKWDLDKASIQFGGLISTSNVPVSSRVMVSSDTDLLWTISIQHLQTLLKERVESLNEFSF